MKRSSSLAGICFRFWRTASAVPWYQLELISVCSAERMSTKPPPKGSNL